MAKFRRMKALVLLFTFVLVFTAAFAIVSADTATAKPACCIYVMKCTVEPPIYCWCECIPVPCP